MTTLNDAFEKAAAAGRSRYRRRRDRQAPPLLGAGAGARR